jgi:membrane protease YdiL (CAAX protease family)
MWVAVAACIFAPLKEELMFRVILQGRLVDRLGVWGVLATAMLFASVHRIPDAFMLIPLAMFLGFLYERRRTFLSVFAAHAAFNGANVLMALAIT